MWRDERYLSSCVFKYFIKDTGFKVERKDIIIIIILFVIVIIILVILVLSILVLLWPLVSLFKVSRYGGTSSHPKVVSTLLKVSVRTLASNGLG